MKIQDIRAKHPPFDVPSGLFQVLTDIQAHCFPTKFFETFPRPEQKPKPAQSTWQSIEADRMNSGEPTPPYIRAWCATCGANIDFYGGANPSVQKLMHKATCTGGQESCPPDVAAEHLERRKAFYPPRPLAEQVKSKLQEFRESVRPK
jgi:hypothetical protein